MPRLRGPGPMDGRGDVPPSLPSFSRRLPPSMETTSHYVKAHLGKQGGTERWLDLDWVDKRTPAYAFCAGALCGPCVAPCLPRVGRLRDDAGSLLRGTLEHCTESGPRGPWMNEAFLRLERLHSTCAQPQPERDLDIF